MFWGREPGEEQPLWKRNLYVLWTAQFLAMMGMSACVPFLPTFIKELGTHDAASAQIWSGFVFSGPFLVSFMVTPIWSALGDRYSRKMIILRAVFGLSIAMTFMGFSHSVEELFIWRVIQGAISGFVAANLSFISAETPQERVGYAIGVLQSSQSAGAVTGPFLGGAIANAFGMRPAFWAVGVLACISGLLVWLFVKESERKHNAHHKASGAWKNIRYAVGEPDVLLVLLLIILSQMSIVFTTPIFPFYLEELGTPKEWLPLATGAFVGIVGVCSLIFTPRWGRRNDSKGYRKTIRVAALVVGITTIFQAVVRDPWSLLALRFMIGAFVGGVVPSLSTALSKLSPEAIRGGIMGLASSAMLLGNLLSPPFSGWLSTHTGLRWCFVIAGVMMLGVSFGAAGLRDVVREQRSAEEAAERGVRGEIRIAAHEIHD